ncbi:NAD(P)H-dependent oxidoreductase [Rhodococcus sp. HNM0563]|uniref:NADPH-dependent FMN reductase n=1 Tax=unclassified Rhodococcus (in: high G+C Gram-positive bacteria) TaxID=192944 RepID=UPI00146CC1E1|nr:MULTISPECIES: NAD(P)H-dependent oxidoreductase [unclassified Rhodococcus (in: high G+C Gram-positive bacteria)]MCK0093288.1 NAD(P)H-dependent oxidoreductase [Rhodococcus sp. F64268]NLU60691.1 NAD(P)H-dependent oxidoreductase [Rhodococcus sp. HNM0563]
MDQKLQVPIRLGIIVASVREGRVAPVVANWFAEAARRYSTVDAQEFDIDIIDLARTPLPQELSGGSEVEAFTRRIDAAEAFVVVTSEYNHGYPAALKTAIDSVKHEWRAKPVGFVSYGGLSGGLRAVEQLRQVVVEVHMVPVRESVSFHRVKHAFDADGTTRDGAAIDAAERMLGQLEWWVHAVRCGRRSRPYPG